MEDESRTVIAPDQPVTMGQLLQLFKQLNPNKPSTETSTHTLLISEKLTNQNYTKWSRLMHLAISGRDRLNHIIDDPPPTNDPAYNQWIRSDSIVISWILENIESDLVNQYLDFPTAKTLWQGIETLYSSGRDGLQIFDLTVKTNKIQQGPDTIETYYSKLIVLWKEIDRRQPNPMKDPCDIIIYNQITQQNKLYQFLGGINETYDKDRRDLLLLDPLPTVEEAYASIRREILRRGIMKTNPSSDFESLDTGGIFSVKGKSYRREDERSHLKCTYCGGTRHTRNECFKLVGYPEWWPDSKKRGERKPAARFSDQTRMGKAAVGWRQERSTTMEEGEKPGEAMNVTGKEEGIRNPKGGAVRRRERSEGREDPPPPFKGDGSETLKEGGSRGSFCEVQESRGSSSSSSHIFSVFSSSFNTSSYFDRGWIIDCGATDTMSYDPNDFLTRDTPIKKHY